MEQCHQPILELVKSTFDGKPATVFDLGCGNGALLKKICNDNTNVVPFGIDINETRIAHAHELHPSFVENFVAGNIFEQNPLWNNSRYSLIILMPGRFLEVQSAQREFMLRQLQNFSDKLIVYAYDDWLIKYGGLVSLAEQAGLKLMSNSPDLKAGLAVINNISDHQTNA